ncbi:MAG: mannose-6-phosphate isomerase, class I [Chitinophagaceae bacterium]|nr:mannose-6-phosphate isomerase, class I [Chitinophagaceae bacterium]
MFKLTGKLQHYAWGGKKFIPQLLGIENNLSQPHAEYWMGAHANGPALVALNDEHKIQLDIFIRENAEKLLGKKVADRFGGLPFLFKVLDVKDMLSIQVHPAKAEAEKGFDRENLAGIPPDAPHRNYKDRNHKPEIMVALSEFWLLHGFKEKALITQTLKGTEGLAILLPVFEREGYYGLYKQVMELPQPAVDNLLQPALLKSEAIYRAGQLSKSSPFYWAWKAIETGNNHIQNLDRGIFSIFLFNIVHLQPGQAIFQGAGVPHAYLEGQNIELMANSDNVLRGGLTLKHVDVAELLKHTLFESVTPRILTGEKKGTETRYPCPVPDFELSKVEINKTFSYNHTAYSIEILLLTEGEADIDATTETIHLKKGESVLAGAGETYSLHTRSNAVLYKAGVPES